MPKINWSRTAAVTVSLAGGLLLIYVLGRYAVSLFLPFLIAFFLALVTRPAVLWLARRTRCPVKLLAAAVTLLTLTALCALCYFLFSRILVELQRFILFLVEDSTDETGKIAHITAFFRALSDRIPLLERLRQMGFWQHFVGDGKDFLTDQLRVLLSRFSEGVTALAAGLLRRLPALLLFFLVTVISCFYFSVDFEGVCDGIARLLPAKWAERLPAWRERAGAAFFRYLRAYALLFLMTVAELVIGFLILRVEYVFLLAFLTAALDVLPILGVGTVLLPYALFSFATGDVFRGVGLLVLYGVITVVRQIAEPHLVGRSLGLHPIPMLISFYVGWRLFGVAGVLIGPAVAMLLKALLMRSEKRTA